MVSEPSPPLAVSSGVGSGSGVVSSGAGTGSGAVSSGAGSESGAVSSGAGSGSGAEALLLFPPLLTEFPLPPVPPPEPGLPPFYRNGYL